MFVLLLVSATRAAVLTVGPAGDFPTVADAVATAANGDRIEVAAGSYLEPVTTTVDLEIVGSPAVTVGAITVASGTLAVEALTLDPASDGIRVRSGANLVGTELVAVGWTTPRVHVTDGTAAFDGCTFTDGVGAAVVGVGAEVEVRDSTFARNTIPDRGGSVQVDGGSAVIDGCTFEDNDAAFDSVGALWVAHAPVVVSGSTFSRNQGVYSGAVSIDEGDLTVVDSVFTDNVAAGWGGAIYLFVSAFDVSGSTFTGNRAEMVGGGVAGTCADPVCSIRDSVFVGNSAGDSAGAVSLDNTGPSATLELVGNDLSGNWSTGPGWGSGGAAVLGGPGPIAVRDNTFFHNESQVSGGAVIFTFAPDVEVVGNRFCGNHTEVDGGAILHHNALYGRYTNNLFVDNAADGPQSSGGGLYTGELHTSNVAFVIENNTFVGNVSTTGGAHIDAANRLLDLRNNLFVHGRGGPGLTQVPFGGSRDYDLWFDNDGADLGGDLQPANRGDHAVTENPRFQGYSANGDCTDDLLALQPGSPAIDAGDEAILDPDGSRSDIGATGGPDALTFTGPDVDGDGYFGGFADCDDGAGDVHPGAVESCNGVDDDCDGTTDGPESSDASLWYADLDHDGFGDPTTKGADCAAPPDTVAADGDCDDGDPAIHEGQPEVSNGLDDDCDGVIDDGAPGVTGEPEPLDRPVAASTSGCGCATSSGPSPAWLLPALGVLLRRRRVLVLLAVGGSARAAVLTVGPAGDHPTIGGALAVAVAGDRLELAPGTWSESVEVGIELAIVGTGGSAATTLDGSIRVTGGALTLEGLTLAPSSDRGIDVRPGAALIATDLVVSDRPSTLDGPAIRVVGGTLALASSVFERNTGALGGAIFLDHAAASFADCSFVGNHATDGGAIHSIASTVTVGTSAFADNVSNGVGGALTLDCDGVCAVSGSTFERNVSDGYGGAIDITGTFDLSSSGFVANTAGASGGAVSIHGSADVRGNTFADNSTAVYGGGLWADRFGADIEVVGNTFCANHAIYDGAGLTLYNVTGAQRVVNNLLVDNDAAEGGGLFVGGYGGNGSPVEIENNTFAGNHANAGGLGSHVLTDLRPLAMRNNVFAGTIGTAVVQLENGGQRDYDLWWDNGSDLGGALSNNDRGPNAVEADPLFHAYTADGDCSNDLFALQPGSPAIDGGDPTVLDRDGSVSDIGAFGGLDALTFDGIDEDEDGWFAGFSDCDDGDPTIHPGAEERCDGIDQDCDQAVDEDAVDAGTWYPDLDHDEHGDAAAEGVRSCEGPADLVEVLGDCDDQDPAVHEGQPELCNTRDDDCDGVVDEDLAAPWFEDQDGDGVGAAEVSACAPADGLVGDGGDCDDQSIDIHPGAQEVAGDGVDQDCDGVDLVEDPDSKGGCGCGTGPGGSWVAGLVLLALRRRSPARAK